MTIEGKIVNTLSYYDKVLDEKNGLIKHLMEKNQRLRDCLERCEQDYHGITIIAKQFSLYATLKDSTETREYIRKALAD